MSGESSKPAPQPAALSAFRGKKSALPAKDCAACGRPFSWRKKWARDWENVRYCSERCRRSPKR